ncbi:MAG TPA: hypothetical protein VMV74_05920 [Bacteroidales bacterium]|nr:hypothetical protein [Bacteroidales bacterium]
MGDLAHGMRIQTSVVANATYLDQVQYEIFNVYGRILVKQLYCEAITVFGAQGTTLLFNATFTVPAVAVQPMTGASAALTSLAQGNRAVYVGGAVASAPVITGGGGVSDVICQDPQIIGSATIAGVMGVGTIGILTAAASQLSGTCQFVMYWAPMEDGSYVTAIL